MKVPCIICLKSIDVKDKKIIATICKNCLTDKNIKKIGSNFTLKDLDKLLKKYNEEPKITEYGELI